MRKLALTGLVGSTVLATALTGVSPPGCGCETPTMGFGWEVGMFTPPDYALPEDLTPSRILEAAERRYVGHDIAGLNPPPSLRDGPCIQQTKDSLVCRYWLATGPLREEGFKLTFVTDAHRKVSAVLLHRTRRWLGTYETDL